MSGVDFDADADDIEEPRPATEPEDGPVEPFFDIVGRADGSIQTRAGWEQDADIHSLAIDLTAPADRAEAAFAMAFGWYYDTLVAIQQQAAAEGGTAEATEVADE